MEARTTLKGAQTMGRTLINGWLKVVRIPVDVAVNVLPGGQRGLRASATSVVERADASVREHLGGLLRDEELRADGRRRQIAAHERRRAAELRLAAEEQTAEVETRAAEQVAEAEEQRQRARQTAEAEEAAVARRRQEREATQAKAAATAEQAVDDARRAEEETASKAAKRQRLAVLDDQADALSSEADALVASDEADRLAKAAGAAKAARRQTG
jgi:hypothetical protein